MLTPTSVERIKALEMAIVAMNLMIVNSTKTKNYITCLGTSAARENICILEEMKEDLETEGL